MLVVNMKKWLERDRIYKTLQDKQERCAVRQRTNLAMKAIYKVRYWLPVSPTTMWASFPHAVVRLYALRVVLCRNLSCLQDETSDLS